MDIEKFKSKLIQSGHFCKIKNNNLKDSGLNKNDLVYVAGHKAIPEDLHDPYTQRIKFIINKLEDNHVDLSKFMIVDPRSLKRVGEKDQKILHSIFVEDFESKENETSH